MNVTTSAYLISAATIAVVLAFAAYSAGLRRGAAVKDQEIADYLRQMVPTPVEGVRTELTVRTAELRAATDELTGLLKPVGLNGARVLEPDRRL